MKIIRISEETHKRLKEFGTKAETFNDVILRLLDDQDLFPTKVPSSKETNVGGGSSILKKEGDENVERGKDI